MLFRCLGRANRSIATLPSSPRLQHVETANDTSAAAPTTTPLAVLRRRWPLVVAAMVIVPLVAVLLAAARQLEYHATAVVRADSTPFSEDLLGGDQPVLAPNLRQGPSTLDLLSRVVAKSQGGSPSDLSKKIEITVEPDELGAEIEAKDTNAQKAADLANAFAKAYVADLQAATERQIRTALRLVTEQLPDAKRSGDKRQIRLVSRQVNRLSALQRVNANSTRIVRAAERPDEVRRFGRNIGLGLILGALLGCFAAFVVDRLDGRAYRRDEVERVVWPVLGCIDSADPERGVEGSDALARLRHLGGREVARTIGIIPVGGGSETGAALAGDLARAAAGAGQTALVIDADLRRSTGAPGVRQFVLDGTPLEELLAGGTFAEAAGTVSMLAAGHGEEPALAVLEHSRMSALLRESTSRHDAVFTALPPLDEVAHALAIAAEVDAVVLGVVLGRTTLYQLRRCHAELIDAGVTPAGVVLMTARGLRASRPIEVATDADSARQDAVALT